MTDRTDIEAPTLSMQPTGSGVADLEVAYEQMKLAEAAGLRTADASDEAPIASRSKLAETEAHPS